tara:strand:- start:94 stop:612 length:519 start_codon:yes stop_codon:yes gene_type:complete
MASINDNIRGKKLFKQGSAGQSASKGGDGEITVSKEISDDLAALTDISEVFNDDGLYQTNRFLIKQIEDLRLDVEELHAFIKDAFGKSSSSAASQGAKGDTGNTGATGAKGDKGDKGDTGATGATGPQGPAGADGADGSDASVSGASGTFSGTSGKSTVEITVANGLITKIK